MLNNSRCSIVSCISIITITWDLFPSHECLFSPPPHTWNSKIEPDYYVWICITFQIFLFVRTGWIYSSSPSPKCLFHTPLFFTNFYHLLPLSHSPVLSLPSNFTEKIEAIRKEFPHAPITASIYPPIPVSVPRFLPFCRWTVFLEKN